MKKYIIKLTDIQLQIIQTALFEYSEICFDQGTSPATDGTGYVNAFVDKKSRSYILAKAMDKVSSVIYKQVKL